MSFLNLLLLTIIVISSVDQSLARRHNYNYNSNNYYSNHNRYGNGGGNFRGQQSSSTSNIVKIISTNTRSGFVNVDAIVRNSPVPIDASVIPENIWHGAIQIYGKVYDFIIEKGVEIEDEKQYYKENQPVWVDEISKTSVTEEQFTDWIDLQKRTAFTTTSYNIVDNNCLTFVAKACEFLGIQEPKKLSDMRRFALNNRENAEVLQALYEAAKPHVDKIQENWVG